MTTPLELIADALEAPGVGDPAANVYSGYAEQLVAPALVIRPDDPWTVPHAFGYDEERYAVIAAVVASTPHDATVELYALVRYVIRATAGVAGVSYVSASAPIMDDSTGTPFLAASVRLTYRNCDDLES